MPARNVAMQVPQAVLILEVEEGFKELSFLSGGSALHSLMRCH